MSGNGFIFSLDGGITPIDRKTMYNGLLRAFNRIGISDVEIKKRGLNIHAWRHFANTELQKGGLSIRQVQAVIGHKSLQQTDRYTHLNPLEFEEVVQVQEDLLKPDTGDLEKPESVIPVLTLLRPEVEEETAKVS
jgi:integrase